MKKRVASIAAAIAFAVLAPAWMQASSNDWSFSVADLRLYWFGIVPSGLDTVLQYRGIRLAPGVETILESDAGAGYQQNVFFRNPDGTPYTGPTDAGTYFSQAEAVADIGIRQGITWNPELKRNRFEAFAFYRLHYDYDFEDPALGELIFQSAFPDRVQTFINSVYAGFDYDTTIKDRVHRTWRGYYVEGSAEWGPRFFLNDVGGSDYYRVNVTAYGFHPFYESTAANGSNRLSIFGGDFFAVDWAGGASIPIYVMQTIGGRFYRNGVGDAVRGFEAGAYDTNFKAVNNLELRITGPAIVWRDLVPGLYAFVDSGYYGGGYFGDPAPAGSGLLASTGIGAYVDFFGLLNATAYAALPLLGRRVDGAPYAFGAHFHLQF